MRVELWSSAKGHTHLMAVIRSEGGRMLIEAKEPIPPRIQKNLEQQRARVDGDEAFLRSLTVEFSGAYLRAGFFPD